MLGANDDQLKQHYSFLSNSLKNAQNGVEVNLANKAFVNKDFAIKDAYLKSISDSYKAEAQNLDFGNAAKAAETMNEFVKTITKDKIREIVKSDDVTPDSALFLINALYLKADWEEEFEKMSTFDENFHVKEGVTKQIPFMNDHGVSRDYASNDQVQVLSLKYKDNAYRFNIFLPKEKFGLEKFVKGVTAQEVQELLKNVKSTVILNLRIPKMKLEREEKLIDLLKKVGINDVFTSAADLSEIADEKLKVTEAVHKAIIEVDEKGTTAAASTMMRVESESMRISPNPIDFCADHPFLFALTYNNHPIFIGVFND
ncbi:hypothetical protein WR25_25726 [Diploscapter pachys]|uniref:Serpin domain-containing protein n=1 Tax=Diploscapter pachys TaxID=2018661 RepID=A0A2A2KW96_9BILA|nr:hypothetical protein WR25_25726 [Diploscapter pachys]